jgi:hypothetical protein
MAFSPCQGCDRIIPTPTPVRSPEGTHGETTGQTTGETTGQTTGETTGQTTGGTTGQTTGGTTGQTTGGTTGAQTPSIKGETNANFKLYENSLYDIKIQYPPSWRITEQDENPNDRISSVVSFHNDSNDTFQDVQILVNNFPTDSVNDYLAKAINSYMFNKQGFALLESGTNATLSARPAYTLVYNETVDGLPVKTMETGTVIGDKVYYVEYTALPDQYDHALKIIQDMINSFQIGGSRSETSSLPPFISQQPNSGQNIVSTVSNSTANVTEQAANNQNKGNPVLDAIKNIFGGIMGNK